LYSRYKIYFNPHHHRTIFFHGYQSPIQTLSLIATCILATNPKNSILENQRNTADAAPKLLRKNFKNDKSIKNKLK
jgi:hypothetical protein